jgi:hypothetical protein
MEQTLLTVPGELKRKQLKLQKNKKRRKKMKLKKQKLTLGKSTIANLNNLELANVYGGIETVSLCVTDCKQCQIETISTEDPLSYESGCYTIVTYSCC